MATVQSIERAFLLLKEIGREPGGLVELAQRGGLPVSTTARLLTTLEGVDAVHRDADGAYGIGPAIRGLTSAADPSFSLQALVHPTLIAVSDAFDEAAGLAVIAGRDVVTVDQVDAPKPIQAENWTGTRVPLHAGSAGLVVMATWAEEDIDEYLAGELVASSAHTVTDPDRLRARIRRIRGRRVMWTHGEYVDGLSSASAPIVDATGRAVAAIYTYGPSYRYPAPGEADRIANFVLEQADAVSAQLGHPRRGNGAP